MTITQSRGITINNSDFDGHQIGGVQNGLSVTNSSDIQISNSEFADFYYGAGFRIVDNLRIAQQRHPQHGLRRPALRRR